MLGGGVQYDIYGLQYLSPTIGLYFFSDEYIRFISRLKFYLKLEMKPLDLENSKYKTVIRDRGNDEVFLGILGDVEVVFVHYPDVEIACKKWNMRRHRINFDNLLIKFNDQNLFDEEAFQNFRQLDIKNKLFFTGDKKYLVENYCVYLSKFEKEGFAVDDIKASRKVVNIKYIFNSLLSE